MKKIICFLLLTVAFTTNAQTYHITGDNTYGNIAVSIIIDGGTPIDIGNLVTGQSLSYTVPSGTPVDALIEIKAQSNAYVFIENNDDYYQLYLDYLIETGTYFDNPEDICIREAYGPYNQVNGGAIDFFIGTLPK